MHCRMQCVLVVPDILQTDYPFSHMGKAYYSTTSGVTVIINYHVII